MSPDNVNPVAELERIFLPLFRAAEEQIASEYQEYKFSVTSCSIGGATEYQGHDIYLGCTFPDAGEDETNGIAMCVGT